jgi:HEPN domain-containing protein
MGVEKQRAEAGRWIETALEDLDAARVLRESGKFAHACFHAQQAGEKAVKAVWHLIGEDPWGHSLKKLIEDLGEVDQKACAALSPVVKDGMVLDRFYIPTRYPNGLPDITPAAAFDEADADACRDHAEKIVRTVKALLEERRPE